MAIDQSPENEKKNYGFPMGWWISRWESKNITLKKPMNMGISHHCFWRRTTHGEFRKIMEEITTFHRGCLLDITKY